MLFAVGLFAEENTPINQPDPQEIVRSVASTYQRNIDAAADYTFQQRSITREFDKNGNVTKTRTRTYETVFLFGEQYRKLIAIDDKPLNKSDLKREERRLNTFFNKRKEMSDADRAKKKESTEQTFMREIGDELPYILNYEIIGEEMIDGQPVWVIQATPKNNYKPKSRTGKMFSKLSGKVWVTKDDYTWVKLEADFAEDFSVGGFLFKIRKGSRIEIESTLINDEVWLPRRSSINGNVRALWSVTRPHAETIYSRYEKFVSDAKITYPGNFPDQE